MGLAAAVPGRGACSVQRASHKVMTCVCMELFITKYILLLLLFNLHSFDVLTIPSKGKSHGFPMPAAQWAGPEPTRGQASGWLGLGAAFSSSL